MVPRNWFEVDVLVQYVILKSPQGYIVQKGYTDAVARCMAENHRISYQRGETF